MERKCAFNICGVKTIVLVIVGLSISTYFSSAFAQELKAYDTDHLKALMAARSDANTSEIEQIIEVNRKSAHDTSFYTTLLSAREHFRNMGDAKRVIQYGEELIALAKKMERFDQLGQHYSHLTHQYWLLGDFEKQYEASTNGEFYSIKYKDTASWIVSLTSFARLLYKIDEFDAAIERNKKAFELNQQFTSFDRRGSLLKNRAIYLYKSDRLEEALSTIKASEKFNFRNYDTSLYYNILGTIYYYTDSLDKAEASFKKLKASALKTARKDVIHSANYHTGLIYFKRKDYEKAKSYLTGVIPAFEKTGSLEFLQKTYETLYDIAEIQGNTEDSHRYLKLSKNLSDSLDAELKIKELSKDYYKNVIRKKEDEKNRASTKASQLSKEVQEEKTARTYSIIALAATIIVLMLIVWFWLKYRKRQRLERRQMQRHFSDSMELKNKELASMHVRSIHRTNNIQEVDSKISEISKKIGAESSSESLETELKRVKQLLQSDSKLKWDDFRYYFEQINEDFFDRIRKRHPNITTNDEKIIAYIKIGLDNRQISELLNVAQKTVHTQRYRLRRKFNIDRKTDLRRYLEDEFGKEK